MAVDERETGTETHNGKRLIGIGIVVLIAVGVITVCLAMGNRFDPPVIRGVREEITVFEDDDLQAALMDGVTAVGGEDRPGETFPVAVAAFAESGEEVQTYAPGTYRLRYTCGDGAGGKAEPVESTLIVLPADREAPVIAGVQDMTVEVGGTVSYRGGVTVTDNVDPSVQLRIDAGGVDLTRPGAYSVVYSAADSRGNEAAVTATVTVVALVEEDPEGGETAAGPARNTGPAEVTEETVYELADRILGQITKPGMSQREKAKAIFTYVHGKIRYVGDSDKSSWLSGAYVGLTRGRGDCYNYFAASKLLLTRADIPNVDLTRAGGNTDHYWQLVDVGNGYYHFDACPHPNGYPITSFLLTEAEARDYSERCKSVRKNYYVYDYDACPVTVAGMPSETLPAETPLPTESPLPETEPPAATQVPTETQAPALEPPAETAAPAPAETQTPPESPPTDTQAPTPAETQTPGDLQSPEPPAETPPPAPAEAQAPAEA